MKKGLSPEIRNSIFVEYNNTDKTAKEIAEKYGICSQMIYNINREFREPIRRTPTPPPVVSPIIRQTPASRPVSNHRNRIQDILNSHNLDYEIDYD